ncbi:hypothetical protein ERO13_A01G099400v2 [Gossypium hirsutum]|uniref:Transmembrane protein n=2 Tax=Gossypium TaxID=3633 RepID=A0A5D3ABK8_GOSMU|nr:hypothetical protein ERO13_A01G099400v2 [Gossypium hirsutum]TYI42697.1 hypothetical protein ES332_A01G117200v1 [Gossypium tomentosum]TYJ48985.1 hypothetical protein E1A91_A01G103600v1 [Gossypium mustelinum]
MLSQPPAEWFTARPPTTASYATVDGHRKVMKTWRRNGRGACYTRAGTNVRGGVRGDCRWLRSCGAWSSLGFFSDLGYCRVLGFRIWVKVIWVVLCNWAGPYIFGFIICFCFCFVCVWVVIGYLGWN